MLGLGKRPTFAEGFRRPWDKKALFASYKRIDEQANELKNLKQKRRSKGKHKYNAKSKLNDELPKLFGYPLECSFAKTMRINMNQTN